MSNTNLVTNLNADLLDGKEGTYYTDYADTKVASKLDTSIFNSHASNNDINVKHLTNAQLNYLNNLISWWKIDANGNLYTEKNLYSTLEVSAYGAGTGSEGNGGATILDDLTDVTIVNPLNNQFLVYNFSTKQWENQTISFTPTSHSHSISDITGLQNNLTFLYDHTTNTTVHLTQEDRDYLNNLKTWWRFNTESQKLWTPYDVYSEGEISAYGAGSNGSGGTSYSRLDSWLSYDSSKSEWVLSALLGKDLDDRVSSLESGLSTTITETDPTVGSHIKAITPTNIYNWNATFTYAHIHDNKTIIDQLSQSNLDVLSKLSLVNGKLQISVDTYSTGELSAYGAGEGGSGSSYSRLDTWASYDATKADWVLSALLGNDLNTRVASLESNALLASAYTASDVLTKLKTVDGSGSGLDADLLDGFHAGGVSGAYWSKIPVVGADGVMEVGAYLDFHEANTGTSNYDGRLSSVGTAAFWNGNRMWHAANSNLPTIDWTAKNITVATDIITNFNTWTNGNSKSLDKFLKLFDIDSNGNLVVKTNLYSTGGISAYQSGAGVAGLKLMGDMNANGKAIYSVNYLQAGLSVQGGSAIIGSDPLGLFGTGMNVGLYNTDNDTVIAAYDDYNGMFYYANSSVTFSNYTNALQSPAFKFGSWTFRQDASGRLGIYNGATEVACFNTDGTYVNL